MSVENQVERTHQDGLPAECSVLERRLIVGYHRIEEAIQAGEDVMDWEKFWIELLHQYEGACFHPDQDVA